jgi:hypothetical protein
MKLIVINDMDSHTWAIPYTPENVTKVQKAALERGITQEDLDDEPSGLPVGRRWGSFCEVIDTDKLLEFPNYNPLI